MMTRARAKLSFDQAGVEKVLEALRAATFTGRGDHELVTAQLLQFEWIIKTALTRGTDLAK